MSKYLFVYGSLRNEFNNPMASFLNETAQYICDGQLQGFLYDIQTYPGAVHDFTTESLILGQVFKMSNETVIFNVLDPYEGIEDELFTRQICPVFVEAEADKKTINCWVYLFNKPTMFLKKIENGNYIQYDETMKRLSPDRLPPYRYTD